MRDYTYTQASPHIKDTPQANEWSDELMSTWPALRDGVPQSIIDAAAKDLEIKHGMYV